MEEKPPIGLDALISYVLGMHAGSGPLQHLSDAVEVSEHLDEIADHLIGHFVDQARRAGASWTDIGRSMGVTKQAAQKRFVPREPNDAKSPSTGIFSRFTDHARHAVTQAQEEARQARHAGVLPAHIVLGLVHEPETTAGRCIQALGVQLDTVRSAALDSLGPPGDEAMEHVPFAPQSKKLLELTTREAVRLGHNYVGTEHILLALLVEKNPVLGDLGLTHAAAEQWIVQTPEEFKQRSKK
jgi:Clp amino terminal domain, pathogenicity island component